jgi:choline transporter-like protein 2/4/5
MADNEEDDHAHEEDVAHQKDQLDKADHPDNKKLSDKDVNIDKIGPHAKRSCKDILCLLMLIAAWVAMTGVGFVVCGVVEDEKLQPGNPARLINAIDYYGNICGVTEATCGTGDSSDSLLNSNDNSDTKKDDCKDKNSDSSTVTKLNIATASKGYYLPSGSAVCMKECPSKDDYNTFICEYDIQSKIDTLTPGSAAYIALGWYYTAKYQCMPQIETTEYIGYCVPTAATDAVAAAGAAYEDDIVIDDPEDKSFFEKVMADMYNSLGVLGGVGIGVTIIIGFLFLYIMRIPGVLFTLIWGIVLTIFLCFFLPGVLLVGVTYPEWDPKQNDESVHTKTEAAAVLYFGYFFLACAGLFACFICCIRTRIRLAINITKEACKALATMPILIFFPVIQAIGVAIFLIPWSIYCLYLASSGELVLYTVTSTTGQQLTYRDFEYSDNTMYAGLYMLFTFFWTTQFVVAMGQLIIAMSFSMWYFTRDKSKIGNTTVFAAIRTSFRYHMGSAAFGSLIIAIIKTIRAVLNYLKKKALAATKAKKDAACAPNPVAIAKRLMQSTIVVFICCVDCCMWCVEKCMKFINKNAYIQIAIFGYSFCKAARCAFFLILRNLLRIAAVGMVSEIVTMLGKLFIPGVTLFIAYLALMSMDLYSFWFPLIMTFFISWMVTDVFLEVFSMGISTILQCFCADEELFKGKKNEDGTEKIYAEGGLRKAISTTKADNKKSKGCLHCCGGGSNKAVVPTTAPANNSGGGQVAKAEEGTELP